METRSERETCTPLSIAALFIIARTWKQPRCPSADEWLRKLWYIYTMEYYSAIKMNTFESVLMRWMKRAHYTEWSKPERKKSIQYTKCMYMEFRKMVITLCKTKRDRCIEQTFGLCGRRRGWDDSRKYHWNMYYRLWNRSPVQVWCVRKVLRAGALPWPKGDGMGNTCKSMADSYQYMVKKKPLQYCKVISLQLI